MKKIECKTHPKQAITNFCKHSQCFLPLCPECIVIHTAYHREKNWHGHFDTIENTVAFCDSKLSEFEERLISFSDILPQTLSHVKEEERLFYERLGEVKMGIIEMINEVFERIKREISDVYKDLIAGMSQDLNTLTKQLAFNIEELKKKRDGLENSMTKTIIELYSSDFVIRQWEFQKDLEQFEDHLKDQIIYVDLKNSNFLLKDIEKLIRERLLNFNRKGLEPQSRGFPFHNNHNNDFYSKNRGQILRNEPPSRIFPKQFINEHSSFVSPVKSPMMTRIFTSPFGKI